MVHVGMCNGGRDTCIHVPLCTLLLPLPTTTSTPPNTYPSPYLLPWAPPAFLEGWGQDRVRGRHLTAKYYYRGVVRFWLIQSGGGGGGGVHMLLVILNTLMFIEVGGPLGMPTTYYPYSSPYLLLPLFLPLPTTYIPLLLPLPTIPPPLTYHYPYSSPYLLFPWCMEGGDLNGHVCDDDEFTDTLLPEYETYLHKYTVYKLS